MRWFHQIEIVSDQHLHRFDRTIRSYWEQDLDHPRWHPRSALLFGCGYCLDVMIEMRSHGTIRKVFQFQKHLDSDRRPLIRWFDDEMEGGKRREIVPHLPLLI